MQTEDKPLDGYRVVDLTHVLAGPYCTYQLGLLGAEVIKVESLRGDMVRHWGGSDEQLAHRLGTGFAAQNAGKRSLAVNLAEPQGADIVRALADGADIFVENYRPGALARYGLDYAPVAERNCGVIYLSISAFGQTGPHGHRPGFDDVVQATSGFMSINVRGDGTIRTGGPVLDYATGMHAASAVLAAALLKLRTGKGRHIDVAMQDVTMLLINRNTSIAASTGVAPEPAQDREGLMLGRYRAKEGYVMLAGYLPRHRRAICKAIGLAELAELGGHEQGARSEEIEQAVELRLLERSAEEWDDIFSDAGVVA
ncbi:MAG: CoA transferase [Acidobacteriota bacterium]|nr:CoA transferase [Acidobacteriota bacterium]